MWNKIREKLLLLFLNWMRRIAPKYYFEHGKGIKITYIDKKIVEIKFQLKKEE